VYNAIDVISASRLEPTLGSLTVF